MGGSTAAPFIALMHRARVFDVDAAEMYDDRLMPSLASVPTIRIANGKARVSIVGLPAPWTTDSEDSGRHVGASLELAPDAPAAVEVNATADVDPSRVRFMSP